MVGSPCPDDDRLVEYVEGLLEEPGRRVIDQHVDGCPTCRRVLADFAIGSTAPALEGDHAPPIASGFAGRYTLLEIVGTGAMSIVYAAYDRMLDRKIALKVLRDRDPAQAGRVVLEARAMARLTHPNVLALYDAGVVDDQMYLTAELVVGQTVAAWMDSAQRPWREVVEVFIQAGRGLAAAHAAGITHRDFKPTNMLIGEDGRVRVADFGLARRALELESTAGAHAVAVDPMATATGALIGTPAYMSPEQLAGKRADARSDQFAFCTSLFEALHGERPFHASSVSRLQVAIGERAIAATNREVPGRVARLIERGLSVDPGARFASMSDVVGVLESAIAGSRSSRRPVLIGGALLGLVVAGVLGLVLASRPTDSPAADRVTASPLGVPAAPGDSSVATPIAADAGLPAVAMASVPPRKEVPAGSGARPTTSRKEVVPPSSAHHPGGLGTYVRPPSSPPSAAAPSNTPPPQPAQPLLHPVDPAHVPAIQRALGMLGYRGLEPADDLASATAQLAAVPADDRADAVHLEFVLGALHRRQDGCAKAKPSFEAARAEASAVWHRDGELGRASPESYRVFDGRARFALALCQVELGPIAKALAPLDEAHRFPTGAGDEYETEAAYGILRYEMGDTRLGESMLLDVYHLGDPTSRAALATWGKGVGVRFR